MRGDMRGMIDVGTWVNSEAIVRDVVVVGASAGGVNAIIEMLSGLPADLPAFLGIVIHRWPKSTADWSGLVFILIRRRCEPGFAEL